MTVEGARDRKEPAWFDNLLPGRSERVSERRDRNGERVGDSGRENAVDNDEYTRQ